MVTSLVDFRNSKKMSQKELADKLGVSQSLYSKIELGFRNPSYNFIAKFKEVFPEQNIDKIFFNLDVHKVCI